MLPSHGQKGLSILLLALQTQTAIYESDPLTPVLTPLAAIYTAIDENGEPVYSNAGPLQVVRTLVVSDTGAPVITLVGGDTEVACGDIYVELGATAIDDCDGDLTDQIIIGGDIANPSVPGIYIVTYNVVDSDGLAAVEVYNNF